MKNNTTRIQRRIYEKTIKRKIDKKIGTMTIIVTEDTYDKALTAFNMGVAAVEMGIKVYMFLTFIVYSDKNANTTITIRGEDKPFYKNGSHSLLVGMLKIPAMNLLRQLLDDGLIDGNQLFRRYCNIAFGLPKPPIALVLSRIVEKIFGGPIVDVPDSTLEFLRVLHGIEPRYNGSQIFDFPMINYLRDKLMESFPRLAPIIINQSRFFPFLFFSGLFWNRVPVRSSFLHFEMPQKLEGYTHFVWLSKQPVLLPFVKCVQNFIPDVFYDGRLKNN